MAASGQDRIERRLAAILAADVAGYSRLTGVDEEGTHVQLQAHLRALIDPKVAEHRGRVVKNTGDGMLAEFSSVVDAVRCALDVQRGMAERNAHLPEDQRIDVRIGDWRSGLYYAELTSPDGRIGYAPFVVRPTTLGATARVAVVLPTNTWGAYNLRDTDGDGFPDVIDPEPLIRGYRDGIR